MIYQVLIALDQLLNTLFYSSSEGSFGYADETFSARCWRLRYTSRFWFCMYNLVDSLFWFEEDHCFESYYSEVMKQQHPSVYYEVFARLINALKDDPTISAKDLIRENS